MASFGSGMMRSTCWITTIDKRFIAQKPISIFLLSCLIKRNLLHIQMIGKIFIEGLPKETEYNSTNVVPIHWYIMTSPFTDGPTRDFLKSHPVQGFGPPSETKRSTTSHSFA